MDILDWEQFPFEVQHEKYQILSDSIVIVHPRVDSLPVLNHKIVITDGAIQRPPIWNTIEKRALIDCDWNRVLARVNLWMGRDFFGSKTIGERVFYHAGSLVDAYRIQDPQHANRDARVWIVACDDGRVLSSSPVSSHDQGLVFPKDSFPQFGKTPPLTDLLDVVPSTRSIKGRDFQSGNTCFKYKCPTATNNCTANETICVDDPNGTENQDYYTLTTAFSIDGREIDLDIDWQANGYKNNVVYMAWKNSPVASTRLERPPNSIWGSNIDFSSLKGTEQTDSFAELQAYYLFSEHAKFLRYLMADPTFCFLGTGPNCTVNNLETQSPSPENSSPIRFFVNYQRFKLFPSAGSNYPDFMSQIKQGFGKNTTHPIVFYETQPYEDAYFAQRPFFNSSCTTECLSIEMYPYTHFVFGQHDSDWALNSCLVYHELGHALVRQFLPNLPSYMWTPNGLRSDPGALNEAWADYFAAIHCGISDFRKTYNGRPRRVLENSITCADTVGQVHSDSLLFSGALWEFRRLLQPSEQTAFDRIVLKALMTGRETDLFSDQFRSILSLLQSNPTLSSYTNKATEIFNTRELECVREMVFVEQKDPTLTLAHPGLTPANISTLPTILKLQGRASDWGLRLDWRQYTIHPWLGVLDQGYATASLKMAMSPCPITLQGNTSQTWQGISTCTGNPIEWTLSHHANQMGWVEYPLQGSVAYLMVASEVPAIMVMWRTTLTLFGFHRIWRITLCLLSIPPLILFCLLVFRLLRKEKFKNVWLLLVSFLVASTSGICSCFALLFGSNRDLLTWVGYLCWFFHTLMNHVALSKVDLVSGSRLTGYRLAGYRIAPVVFLTATVSTLVTLILLFVPSSTIATHAIVYLVFFISNMLVYTIITSGFWKNSSNSQSIPLHSLYSS